MKYNAAFGGLNYFTLYFFWRNKWKKINCVVWFVLRKTKKTYIFRAEIFVNSQKETIFAPQLQKRWNNDFILKTKKNNCENSSVGRARPCQGRGRGFESRFSLLKFKTKSETKEFRFFSLYNGITICPNGEIGRHASFRD